MLLVEVEVVVLVVVVVVVVAVVEGVLGCSAASGLEPINIYCGLPIDDDLSTLTTA
jgi:hypothetical protein